METETTTDVVMSASITLEQLSPEALATIEEQLRPVVYEKATKDVLARLKEDNELRMAKVIDDLYQENEKRIQDNIKQWEEAEAKRRKPITGEELQQLLSQKYATFTVKIWSDGKEMEFVLRELPKYYEEMFYGKVKVVLKDAMEKLGGENLRSPSENTWDKIVGLMDLFEPAFNLMAECCAICLSPMDSSEINAEWVSKNLSSYRIVNIIKAQVELNKLRDFFSELFQGFLSGGITNPAAALL